MTCGMRHSNNSNRRSLSPCGVDQVLEVEERDHCKDDLAWATH